MSIPTWLPGAKRPGASSAGWGVRLDDAGRRSAGASGRESVTSTPYPAKDTNWGWRNSEAHLASAALSDDYNRFQSATRRTWSCTLPEVLLRHGLFPRSGI